MKIILHRINKREVLRSTPQEFGVEVDIRSYGDDLVIHHEPFLKGELFNEWIEDFNHGTLILNVKEEGLEERLLKIMDDHDIEDFFFLDQSFPFLRKSAMMGESRCAVRISEYESIETALSLSGMVEWVWVDCFSHFPLMGDEVKKLQEIGFKLCFVSPELQGRTNKSHIVEFRKEIELQNIYGDAVCTKYPELWE
jgi:hypothetical protein